MPDLHFQARGALTAGNTTGHALPSPPDWGGRPDCYQHPTLDPEAWTLTGLTLAPENRDALDVCDACPVRQTCLDDAMNGSSYFRASVIRGGQRFNPNGNPIPRDYGTRLPRPNPAANWPDHRLREAHAAYNLGVRTPETECGEREYQRRKAIEQRARARALRDGTAA